MTMRACAPVADNLTLSALADFSAAAARAGFNTVVFEARSGFDPLTAAAAVAPLTEKIRLAPEVIVDRGEPFTLARGLAALDHLSGGRAAWRIGSVADIARAREFVAVTCRLWDSWQSDAIVFDKANAVFSDPAKVACIDHHGSAFQVRGPLNTPRPPQGRVPLIVDAGSPLADIADIVIGQSGATFKRCTAKDLS